METIKPDKALVYKQKPLKVRAVQWVGDNLDEVKKVVNNVRVMDEIRGTIHIEDPNNIGFSFVSGIGQYIILNMETLDVQIMDPQDFNDYYEFHEEIDDIRFVEGNEDL